MSDGPRMGWYDSSRVGAGQDFQVDAKAGGTSGSTSMSLKLRDSFTKSQYEYESGTVKNRSSFDSRRTMRMRGPPKIILRNSQFKGKGHLKVI